MELGDLFIQCSIELVKVFRRISFNIVTVVLNAPAELLLSTERHSGRHGHSNGFRLFNLRT